MTTLPRGRRQQRATVKLEIRQSDFSRECDSHSAWRAAMPTVLIFNITINYAKWIDEAAVPEMAAGPVRRAISRGRKGTLKSPDRAMRSCCVRGVESY